MDSLLSKALALNIGTESFEGHTLLRQDFAFDCSVSILSSQSEAISEGGPQKSRVILSKEHGLSVLDPATQTTKFTLAPPPGTHALCSQVLLETDSPPKTKSAPAQFGLVADFHPAEGGLISLRFTFSSKKERFTMYQCLISLSEKHSSASTGSKMTNGCMGPTQQPTNIFIASWGPASASILASRDTSWLPKRMPDVLVFSFQGPLWAPEWKDTMSFLSTALGPDHHILSCVDAPVARLAVFVSERVRPQITRVATGQMTWDSSIGGACACYVRINETPLCFVCTQFVPGPVPSLNSQYFNLLNEMKVEDVPLTTPSHHIHYLFIAGDFGYHIDLENRDSLQSLVKSESWDDLYRHDALDRERSDQMAFAGFREAPLKHPPESLGSDSMGWSSRIVWHSLPGCDVATPLPVTRHREAPRLSGPLFGSFNVTTHLPFASLLLPPCPRGPVKIKMSNVCVSKLVQPPQTASRVTLLGSAPDPYLCFDGPFLESPVNSSVCFKSAQPTWAELPPLTPFVSNREHLKTTHITVTLMDYDATGEDQMIGEAFFGLKNACVGEPVSFMQPLYLNGKVVGELSCKLHVVWPQEANPPMPSSSSDLNLNVYRRCPPPARRAVHLYDY